MDKYNPQKNESKWQKYWEKNKIFKTKEDKDKLKYYVLDMFPYPSGAGLHVGHPKGYIATDVVARMKMMQGYNVLHPMGWDAFGLPTENYAIKNKIHPREATEKNIKIFKKQLGLLGFTYDWEREINTTDPNYYKWTQWIFLQMFKRGLAYESFEPINWCPKCQTGLANEDLEEGKCERCGSQVERKPLRQWVLKITDYAERLLNDLEKLPDWPEPIKEMQKNWIGRSEGALVKFGLQTTDYRLQQHQKTVVHSLSTVDHLKVFTTRPDTLFGATYMVIAPEHKIISDLRFKISNFKEVAKYIEKARHKSDLERTELQKQKTGVELKGLKAINPVNNEEIPIFVADYVMMGYGTGAIMAVPAHDERDWEFAKKYGLPIREVVQQRTKNKEQRTIEKSFAEDGTNINSGFLDGLKTPEAKEKMIQWLEEKGAGKRQVQYKLRDWVFSRQRYWGEPIPLVHCEKCKNKKYHYVLLHGYTGEANKNWKPWLKQILEERGNTVFCPDLPNTDKPNIDEQVQYVLDNTKIDENTVLVGHSLGGAVIMKLLEKLNRKVAKVLFIDSVLRPKWPDKERPAVVKSCDWKFNFEKIKKLSSEFIILGDAGFKTIFEKDLKDLANYIGGRLVLSQPEDRHFTAEKEPMVLQLLNLDGWVPLPESELPLELPKVKKYEPTGTGESPLANIKEWVNTKCPKCGGPAKRETNTMPQWAGSCWYYLAYIMRGISNFQFPISKYKEMFKRWLPVDLYVGGAEHATRHLIYARFWHKFLYDIGLVSREEPFTRLQNVGLVLAEDGRKMSKRWNNIINPDEIVKKFGADALRLYEMFMGPFGEPCAWSTPGVVGVRRFLEKVWGLNEKATGRQSVILSEAKDLFHNSKLESLLHKTIKKITEDIENFKFNTAISALMILTNEMSQNDKIFNISARGGSPPEADGPRAHALGGQYSIFLKLLSPFAPHIAEELWLRLGHQESILKEKWPQHDASLIYEEEIQLVVQINGKMRDTFLVPADISEEEAKKKALSTEKIQKWLAGQEPKKVIYVKGKLVSIVI